MRKIKLLLALILMVTVTGCGPRAELQKRYKKVVFFNGVTEYEAVTIAEKQLVDSPYSPFFETTKAKIRTDKAAQKYPNYWFVDFSQELLFDSPSYIVVIDKQNGDILLSDEYFPKKITDLDWVFQRLKSTSSVNVTADPIVVTPGN